MRLIMYNIISTGSRGNAVIYHGNILVDVGVPYSRLWDVVIKLQLVLLTHSHTDHVNVSTVNKLAFERPSLRFGCGEWMLPMLKCVHPSRIDVYAGGEPYDYGSFTVSPFNLTHDVPNFGYRIFKGDTSIFHATDTSTLRGITAKNYSLYCIEHNYDSEVIMDSIAIKEVTGEFSHEKRVLETHLSEEEARDFIRENKGEHSKVVRLHEHS